MTWFTKSVTIATLVVASITRAEGGEAATSCAALAQIALPDTVVTSTAVVEAQGAVPAYCKVLGTVAPETDIELRLPAAWQGRLLHLGGSGLDGSIPNLDLNNVQLQQGYALVGSNGGHRDPTGGPTRFLNQPALIQDYAHGAIGKTVLFAKAIVRTYYGDSPRYSYFAGCSNGGRGAFNAAAKYAGEYDGVIAGAPTLNMAGLISGGSAPPC